MAQKFKAFAIGSFIGLVVLGAVAYVAALQYEVEFYRSHESMWTASCEELRAQVAHLRDRNAAMQADVDEVESALVRIKNRRDDATRPSKAYFPLRDFLSDDGRVTWTSR